MNILPNMTHVSKLVCLFLVTGCVAASARQTEMLVSDTCPDDITTCYNGSTCILINSEVKIPDSDRKYRCDCSQDATDSIHHYAGYECEFPAKEFCFLGQQYGGKSFCTDNGDCLEVWQPASREEAVHKGCQCDDGYEGAFCEYELGSGPVEETVEEKSRRLGVFFAILVSSVAVAVAAVSGLFVKKRIANKVKEEKTPPPTVVNNDSDII
mmetsp:Transcript_29110/g.44435  ORF Transcript_29110/g.44435 Transcript_29110/m.44435 type:complete len:211 (+) Transcript_29110:59-691(+)